MFHENRFYTLVGGVSTLPSSHSSQVGSSCPRVVELWEHSRGTESTIGHEGVSVMRGLLIWAGVIVLVGGGAVVGLSMISLGDIERDVQTARDVPFVGGVAATVMRASYAEDRNTLEEYRDFGIMGIVAGVVLIGVGMMIPKKERTGKKGGETTVVVTAPAPLAPAAPQAPPATSALEEREQVRVCLACGLQNSYEAKFCSDCGKAMVRPD